MRLNDTERDQRTIAKPFESIAELEAAHPTIGALEASRYVDLPDGLTYQQCAFPLSRSALVDEPAPGSPGQDVR